MENRPVCGIKLQETAVRIAQEVGAHPAQVRMRLLIAHAELGRKVQPARKSGAVVTRFHGNGQMEEYHPFAQTLQAA